MTMQPSSDRGDSQFSTPLPAGGMPSRPSDPPSASTRPNQGHEETNRDATTHQAAEAEVGGDDDNADHAYETAFVFGWQSRLHYGRGASTNPQSFENVEEELEKKWRQTQEGKNDALPWRAARAAAREAWERVFNSIDDGAGQGDSKTGG
jgi:hypothetical protein